MKLSKMVHIGQKGVSTPLIHLDLQFSCMYT